MRILCPARASELTLIRRLFAAFAVLATIAPSTLGREKKTLTLTASQARGADAQLDASTPTTNYGTAQSLNVAAKGSTGNASRAIIQFDFSSLSNVGVKRADMSLVVTAVGNKQGSYEAHRVTNIWTESAVTWTNRVAGTAWATAGGEFNATATAAVTINAAAPGTYTWGLTTDVQNWYSGTQNFGHVILENPSAGNDNTGILFNSRNATSNQPQIALTFLQQV